MNDDNGALGLHFNHPLVTKSMDGAPFRVLCEAQPPESQDLLDSRHLMQFQRHGIFDIVIDSSGGLFTSLSSIVLLDIEDGNGIWHNFDCSLFPW